MQIVKLDEGNGPVPVVRGDDGRIITRAQLAAVHARQDAEYRQAAELCGKLKGGDSAATDQVVEQVSTQARQRLAALARHKADLESTLAKLEAKEAKTTADVVTRVTRRLDRRAALLCEARNRTAALLAELDAPKAE
jgi:hypothetical protein